MVSAKLEFKSYWATCLLCHLDLSSLGLDFLWTLRNEDTNWVVRSGLEVLEALSQHAMGPTGPTGQPRDRACSSWVATGK